MLAGRHLLDGGVQHDSDSLQGAPDKKEQMGVEHGAAAAHLAEVRQRLLWLLPDGIDVRAVGRRESTTDVSAPLAIFSPETRFWKFPQSGQIAGSPQ